MEIPVFYIENEHWTENWLEIKFGYLIRIFEDDKNFSIITNGKKKMMAEIREPVDKYRPEHFHVISLENVKLFDEELSDEIDFLNDMSVRIHERLDDLWDLMKTPGVDNPG